MHMSHSLWPVRETAARPSQGADTDESERLQEWWRQSKCDPLRESREGNKEMFGHGPYRQALIWVWVPSWVMEENHLATVARHQLGRLLRASRIALPQEGLDEGTWKRFDSHRVTLVMNSSWVHENSCGIFVVLFKKTQLGIIRWLVIKVFAEDTPPWLHTWGQTQVPWLYRVSSFSLPSPISIQNSDA